MVRWGAGACAAAASGDGGTVRGPEEARPVLGQLAEEAATGDEAWLTKHGKPMAVLLGREAHLVPRRAVAYLRESLMEWVKVAPDF